MTETGYRRLVAALVVLIAVLLFTVGRLTWLYGVQSIQIAFAHEQIGLFGEMQQEALEGGPETAAKCLRYAVAYYPSGSKQEAGSPLDRIVEQARARSAAEIITHLRKTTKEDLGDDPQRWIEKYAPR